MYTATVHKSETGVTLQMPEEALAGLHVEPGEAVIVEPTRDGLVLRRASAGLQTLDAMLADCDFSQPVSPEEEQWLSAPATGRELI